MINIRILPNQLLTIFLIIIYTLILTKGFWTDINNLPSTNDVDALQQISVSYLFELAVLKYHEFPLWNPYYGGGIPWAGIIWNPNISPFSLLIILFGHLIAIKIYLMIVFILSAVGMYLMLKKIMRLSDTSSFLSSILYVSSLWFAGRFVSGNYLEFCNTLIPLSIFLFYCVMKRSFLGFFMPILLLFQIGAFGKQDVFICMGFQLLFILFYRNEFSNNIKQIGFIYGISVFIYLCLISPKLIPYYEINNLNVSNLNQGYITGLNFNELIKSIKATSRLTFYHDTIGIGKYALIISLFAFIVSNKKSIGLGIILLIGTILTFGPHTPFYKFLKVFPILSTVNSFAKYFNGIILFALCGLFAISIDSISNKIHKRNIINNKDLINLIFILLITTVIIIPLFRTSNRIYSKGFNVNPKTFVQNNFYNISEKRWVGSISKYRTPNNKNVKINTYYNLLRNRGIITWYGNFVFPEYAEPKYIIDSAGVLELNNNYHGEYYCINNSEIVVECDISDYKTTFNTISLLIGENFSGEKLIFNTNYNSGWISDHGNVLNYKGLLAVDLKNIDINNLNLKLKFRDKYFEVGVIIFILGLVFWILFYYFYMKFKIEIDSQHKN